MTRDLWILAVAAIFAMGATFFAGSYHPQSYRVARPETTVVGTAAVGLRR